MATFIMNRWQEASSACSIWFSRSVGSAFCTFLIRFTLVRIDSGNSVGNSRKLVASVLVFPHFWKLRHIRKYPFLYPFHNVLSVFWVVVVLS